MSNCSVIIVNWNSYDYLLRCLKKLEYQSFKDFEIIVVDNNSKEEPPFEELNTYTNLKLIRNDKNIGFAAANNLAVAEARNSEFVVFLNPDTLPQKDWLGKLVQASRNNPEYSFFGSKMVQSANPSILDGVGDVYHMSGLVWRYGHGLEESKIADKEREIFSPCAAAAMFKRRDFLDVGGFDEDFLCYMEDVDLGFRMRHQGYRALYVPKSVVKHYGSGTTKKRSDFSVYHGHRNMVWVWFKNMPLLLLILFFPFHLLYNFLSIIIGVIRGQGMITLNAKLDAIKGLNVFLEKRKKVINSSVISTLSLWKIINKSVFIGTKSKYKKF